MRLIISYLFISLFLTGVFHPTIHVFSGLSDYNSLIYSVNTTTDIPDTNEESENENSKDNFDLSDRLDDFLHHQSLLYFSILKTKFHLSETILVSGFTDIIIPPPKF